MKKTVLTSICLLAVAGLAFGQGKVSWNSISASAVTAQTNNTTYSTFVGSGAGQVTGLAGAAAGATVGASGTYYYTLLYSSYSGSQAAAPTTLAGLSAWTDTGLTGVNSASAGRLTVSGTTGTSVAVPWAAGITQSVMLVGWSSNLGSTWSQALSMLNNWSTSAIANAYFGVSSTGYIAAGGADPGSGVFGSAATAQGLPIYSLNTQLYLLNVPEPGTMALAALGGASLLLFRRRK